MFRSSASTLLLGAGLLLLVACQSTAEKEKSKTPVKHTPSELFVNDLRQNGDKLLCNQPAYLKCYLQTPSRCVKDLSGFKEACLNEALQKNNGQVTAANYKQVGNDFTLCMLVKHALLYPKKAEAIGQCLDKSRFENKPRLN